jgi:hypothetical protein
MKIDHVILAVPDLEEAAARIEAEVGLSSVAGGRHVGLGTGNRIIPLGPDYLELVAVVEPDEARGNPFGLRVLTATASGEAFMGWCLATDDLDSVAARLELTTIAGGRLRPDGTALSWRLAGLDVAMREPSLPFFISWEVPPRDHPGAARVDHRAAPRGIAWAEIAGDERRIRDWTGEDALPIRTVSGDSGLQAVGVRSAVGGDIVLRPR